MGKVFIYGPMEDIQHSEIGADLTAGAINANLKEIEKPKKVVLLAVGDIMMHQSQLNFAYDIKTKNYDFSNYFKYINSYLAEGDIVYANLETPVAGEEFKYSGYPRFNAPISILSELKNNYFTHLSLANNHALDQGSKGLSNTIKNVRDFGFVILGARDDILKSNYEIYEKNGLRVGLISYTYGANGFVLPSSKSFMLSVVDKEKIIKDLNDLKMQDVDIIVSAIHFGQEYELANDKYQKEIAELACTSGADIVLGTHPHTLEPIEYLNNGECLVAYSLGNFISGMSKSYTDLGGILKIEIIKEGDDISLTPDFMGTWVRRGYDDRGLRDYQIVPLPKDKIPEELEITEIEEARLDIYRDFVETKIKVFNRDA